MIRNLLGLGLCALAQLTHAAPPQPFRAEYAVYVDGKPAGESVIELVATAKGHWQHRLSAVGNQGLARLARFHTAQTASVDWIEARPRLLSAEMHTRSLLRDRDLQVEFDWQNLQVRWLGDIEDDQPAQRVLQGAPATGSSLNLQLAFDAAARLPGERVHYVLHDRGRARELDYLVGTAEAVEVPFGRFEAVPMRGERAERQRVTTAWYAGQLPPTPLRMLQTEHGEHKYELRLLRIHRTTAAPTP